MHYLETEFIKYKNNQLYIDEIKVEDLAKKFGTPLYIYSKNHFNNKYKEFENAFKDINHSMQLKLISILM
jgi:diaminopimelate decarboxylase